MLIYITKPSVHECVMGGFRSISLWTDIPHYHHWPIQINDTNEYIDRGWTQNDQKYYLPAKKILEQDEILAEKVWNYIVWSCCPKGISIEEHLKWCNTIDDNLSNYESLVRYNKNGQNADINANINYKRFILEVNLRSNEVNILIPRVHWYQSGEEDIFSYCDRIEETLDIDNKYATAQPYELDTK